MVRKMVSRLQRFRVVIKIPFGLTFIQSVWALALFMVVNSPRWDPGILIYWLWNFRTMQTWCDLYYTGENDWLATNTVAHREWHIAISNLRHSRSVGPTYPISSQTTIDLTYSPNLLAQPNPYPHNSHKRPLTTASITIRKHLSTMATRVKDSSIGRHPQLWWNTGDLRTHPTLTQNTVTNV